MQVTSASHLQARANLVRTRSLKQFNPRIFSRSLWPQTRRTFAVKVYAEELRSPEVHRSARRPRIISAKFPSELATFKDASAIHEVAMIAALRKKFILLLLIRAGPRP